MEKVIIFNGEEDLHVELANFFQDPAIENLTPAQVVEHYQSTTVFHHTLLDLKDLIQSGVVKNVNDKKVDLDYVLRVNRGMLILEDMVKDLFGDEAGDQIIKQTKETLK
jgi:hypothetical protein